MKRVVIGLVIAIVLLVAADFVSASAAEYQVSRNLSGQLKLADDPAVRINGFPFLTQALAGDYKQVDVTAKGLTVGSMSNVTLSAQLYHVRVPLSDVLSGAVRGARIDAVQGAVTINKQDLVKRLPGVTKLSVQPIDDGALDAAFATESDAAPGSSVSGIDPNSAVRLVGTTSVLGQKVDVSVIAVLRLAGNQIEVTPRDIRVGNGAQATTLPAVVQTGLRSLFTVKVDPGTLPFQVTPTRLRAVGDGLEVSGTARDVLLGESSDQSSG
jgi:DUF2993 family protein